MQNATYTAINASAGSGKTYTLVQRILMLCLAYENQHDAIKHILALTFTNKAANEMKERIIAWLKAFTKDDYATSKDLEGIRTELSKRGITASAEDLHNRAKKVLDYVLHNYSMLNIGTIDKFNSRLVRSFSYELGLAHQFNLEIQSEPYLIEAVDKMLEEIGQDEQISEAFMDFVNYNLDNDERVSVNKALYRKAKDFVNDVHYEHLKGNTGFDWQAYSAAKENLREEIRDHRTKAKELAEHSLKIIKDAGLENSDFFGGSNKTPVYFFESYLKNGNPKLYGSQEEEINKVENYRKGASKTGKPKEHLILGMLDTLLENRQQVISHHIAAEKKAKILRELLPLKFNKEIQDKLKEIEDENDLVLLSKFNILISENLKNEPSAFIYEKIGTRYQHYFFDEFQDTSKMQWDNILPLRDNTINSDQHSFTLVGDPKQSIYRFRGGDSSLMLDILNNKEQAPVPVKVENLDNNWRSAKNIVDFNNRLYAFAAQNLGEEHLDLFSAKAEQKPRKDLPGRVKVSLTEYTQANDPFFENVADQMHHDIQECLNNGFSFSDITILCRYAREIQKLSQLLNNKKVQLGGEELYIKTISEKGLVLGLSDTLQAVVNCLRWQEQPDNLQHLVAMMYTLRKLGRVELPDFSAAMLDIRHLQTVKPIEALLEERYGLQLRQKDTPNLNLYNYIEYYVHEFAVEKKETEFLLNFLENLYGFTQNSGLTVKDFLKFWDEEGADISIQASDNLDAIRLMTIHAAKGLEFPVVMIPMLNAHKDSKFHDWLPLEGFDALKSVHVGGFAGGLDIYDTSIKDFNEINTYRNKIDRFCTQYVATTRPVEQLFLYLQKPPVEKKTSEEHPAKIEIYEYVKQFNPEGQDAFDIYPEEFNSFKKHDLKDKPERNTLIINSLSEGRENMSNIKIATPSRQYQNTVETVRMGIFTHEILAKIKTPKDIEPVLERYVLSGEIGHEERQAIKERISAIVSHDEFSKYFLEGQKIINEKDIMISSNGEAALYRPDRLIETAEGYYIIDFKTGAEKDKHGQQVSDYQKVLERLGKKVLETKIIYI